MRRQLTAVNYPKTWGIQRKTPPPCGKPRCKMPASRRCFPRCYLGFSCQYLEILAGFMSRGLIFLSFFSAGLVLRSEEKKSCEQFKTFPIPYLYIFWNVFCKHVPYAVIICKNSANYRYKRKIRADGLSPESRRKSSRKKAKLNKEEIIQ